MPRKASPALAILVAVALTAFAPLAASAATRLTGKVVDAETQAPIANAEVELANVAAGQGYFRARTDRNGSFAFDGVASERYYALNVYAEGYAEFVLGSWQFPAAQRSVEVLIPLDKAGRLEVKVTRTGGRTPVPNARVQIQREQGARWWEGWKPPPQPLYTDAKGAASFGGLEAGFWTVSVQAEGLLGHEARRIQVRRGTATPVPIEMIQPGSLSGTVTLEDGSGIAGVSVIARGPGESVGSTDADGNFTIGNLAPGRWRLETAHEGLEVARTRDALQLAEGRSRDGIALTVKPRAPELGLVLEREAFAPGQPMRVTLRSFRLGVADLSLHEIPLTRLLDDTRDFREIATRGDTAGLTRVRAWQHTAAAGPPFAWREEQVELPKDLPAGAYLLRARSGSIEKRAILFVTELGLLVKRSPERTLVSAASLRDGSPVAGALLYFTAHPNVGGHAEGGQNWKNALREPHTTAPATDATGLAVIPATGAGTRARVVAVSATHGVSVVEVPLAPAAQAGGNRTFLYTDRPLYRPGHTVFWKLFARTGAGDGYALPDATAANLAFRAPDGSTIPVDPVRLSSWGSADGAIVLPPDAALGDWTLTATVGGAQATAVLGVQEYRKPEFRVEVTPDREVYVSGDEVRFRIAADYFFGAPVFGAVVRYNLFETRLQAESSWEEDFEEPARGYGRVLKTGETRTDVDGRATLAFTPDRASYDRRLTLEVEVVDGSNRQVAGRGSAIMGRGLFTIALEPRAWVVDVGAPVVVDVVTRDHAGKPVSASVTLDLDQEVWSRLERRYVRATRPLASRTVTTDAAGRARADLVPTQARSGYMTLRARAEDAKGNRITAERNVWVFDRATGDYAYRYPTLEAVVDRMRYAPGDTAKILVNTEVKDAAVLVAVEGRDLLEHRVLRLTGHSGLVTVPIQARHAPNVFVALHVRKGAEVHSRIVELPVEARRHDLAITLTPDRAEYGPGETAHVDITTRDGAGAPVPAELSLGVVDEAIYALRADATPDPHEVFYGRRPNWVTTAVSFPLLYYAGATKGDEDQVRRDFRDVAHWAPGVITDASGRARVSFAWPDNLTTWRLTSRGATADTRVGKAVAKTLVTKPLVARLAAPRGFVAGDRATLLGVLNNRGRTPLTGVETSLEARGPAKLPDARAQRSDLPPGGEARTEWRVELPPEPPAVDSARVALTFRARGAGAADALEVAVPVIPRAVPVRLALGGEQRGATGAVTVTLPQDLIRAGSALTIDLSPSPAAMALAAVDWLSTYPWGCTEQTANVIIPAAALARAAGAAGVTAPGLGTPAARLAQPLRRLLALQLGDGGWGWWEGGESDPYITALALEALARARGAGLDRDEVQSAIARGEGAMARLMVQLMSVSDQAYVLAHLAPLLALPDAATRHADLRREMETTAAGVYAGRGQLSGAGLALAARAHVALGKTAEARTLLESLRGRAISDAAGLHWPAEDGSGWYGEEEETTAYALQAMLAVSPQDARAADVVRWLAAKRRGPYWRSTRTTGPVAVALADYLAARPAELQPSYRLRVTWNGSEVLSRDVTPADAFGGGATRVRIPARDLKPGDNRLAIERTGTGSVYWAVDARALVPSPGPPTGGRLVVTREYLHAERTADRRGRPRYLLTPFGEGESARVGGAVMVRLTLRAPESLRWVMVEDPRPAGFEVDRLLPEGAEWPWGTHAEERDDRSAFFISTLDAGDTAIEYLVRPEIAGTMIALPATGSGMYDPELIARSREQRLTVVP